MAKNLKTKLDEFHWHEALDRSFLALEFFNERVAEHAAIQATPGLRRQAQAISDRMFRLYQNLGSMTLGDDRKSAEVKNDKPPRKMILGNDFEQIAPWLVALVLGGTVLFFWFVIRREKHRMDLKERFQKGLCVHCGYDLRATQVRCPECGLPIQPPELPLTMRLNGAILSQAWPDEPIEVRKPSNKEFPVEIYTTEHTQVAELLTQQLRLRGVDARESKGEAVRSAVGFMSSYHYFHKIVVWSGDVDRVVEIIRGFESAKVPQNDSDEKSAEKGNDK